MRNHITNLGQKACFVFYKSDIIGKLSDLYSFFHSVCDIGIYNIDCAVMHRRGTIILLKKVPKKHNPRWRHVYVEIQDGRYFGKIVLVDTFYLICYLPWFLSVITKRDNFRTRSSGDEGTVTTRHFSQLLLGYQTSTLVIMFTKWSLMKDMKRNFADTPRTQTPPPQALD